MFHFRFRKNKNIVKVNYTEIVNQTLEGVVNVGLEGSGCISEAER